MNLKRYIELKKEKYELEITRSLSEKDSEKKMADLGLLKLSQELSSVPEAELESLEKEYDQYVDDLFENAFKVAQENYKKSLLEQGLEEAVPDEADIVRLSGKVNGVNGNSFKVRFITVDIPMSEIDVGANQKDYPIRYWMRIFDEQTGLSCKKDDSDFNFEYLKKI